MDRITLSEEHIQDPSLFFEGEVDIVAEKKTKKPQMYRVILLNDDYTPMDFVVWVLQRIFFKNKEDSMRLMMKVHQTGQASCGLFPYEVAYMKRTQVHQMAEKSEHPLQCRLLPEEGVDEAQ